MGAWETDGYNMSINPYWVNKDKESGGGGSDIPDFPNLRGYFLKTVRGDNDEIELEWENFKDNVKEILNPIFNSDGENVGKVLKRYGTGVNDYGWVGAGEYTERISYTSNSFMLGGVQNFNVWDDENHELTISEAFAEISIGTKRTLQDESVDINLPKYAWKVNIPLETLKRVYEFLENPHEDTPQFHFSSSPLYLDGFQYTDDQSQTQTFSGYIVWDLYMTVSDYGDIDIAADAQKIDYNQTYGVYSAIPGVWNMTDMICKMVVKTK